MDKPAGWTSHDVVNKVRRLSGERSIGHLGTLDPLATGVLPLLVGSATRLAKFYGQSEKVYEARIRFGFSTDTYDSEGERTSEEVTVELDCGRLGAELARFRGVIQQMPPAFSAKKVNGVPAYKLARANKPVELKAVDVEIHALDLVQCECSEATIRVRCSSGTYVRSLAHDIGIGLGVGAHLVALRRTRSGDFTIDQSHTLETLAEHPFESAMIPASVLLPEFPSSWVDDAAAAHIRQGRNFHTNPFVVRAGAPFVKAVDGDGRLIAIGEAVLPSVYHPVVVLA